MERDSIAKNVFEKRETLQDFEMERRNCFDKEFINEFGTPLHFLVDVGACLVVENGHIRDVSSVYV